MSRTECDSKSGLGSAGSVYVESVISTGTQSLAGCEVSYFAEGGGVTDSTSTSESMEQKPAFSLNGERGVFILQFLENETVTYGRYTTMKAMIPTRTARSPGSKYRIFGPQ